MSQRLDMIRTLSIILSCLVAAIAISGAAVTSIVFIKNRGKVEAERNIILQQFGQAIIENKEATDEQAEQLKNAMVEVAKVTVQLKANEEATNRRLQLLENFMMQQHK